MRRRPRIVKRPSRFAGMTAEQRRCAQAMEEMEKYTSFPYYSTVKFEALQSGVGPFTYVIPAGTEARAFSYAVRNAMVAGGFTVADGNATPSETNLQTANQTNNGQSVVIYGLSCIPAPGGIFDGDGERFTDARLLAQLWTNVAVDFSINGDEQRYRLGKLENIDGHGGLMGAGYDSLGTQPLDGGRPVFHFVNNGWPTEHNCFRMPEGVIWKAKGQVDGELNIILRVTRDITLYSGGDAANPADDEAAAAGVRGYNYPDAVIALATFYLRGWNISDRSGVA